MTPDLLTPEATEKERVFFANLLVPVHPDYDFDAGDDQFDYANPVALNNKLILYTNAGIELTKKVVVLGRRREAKRLEKKDIERQLKTLRTSVLSRHPAPPSAAKNLALTEAYVVRCLGDEGLLEGAQKLEGDLAKLDDEIELMKEEGQHLRFTMDTIKMACENIQTHLSFVKAELKGHGRNYGA